MVHLVTKGASLSVVNNIFCFELSINTFTFWYSIYSLSFSILGVLHIIIDDVSNLICGTCNVFFPIDEVGSLYSLNSLYSSGSTCPIIAGFEPFLEVFGVALSVYKCYICSIRRISHDSCFSSSCFCRHCYLSEGNYIPLLALSGLPIRL